jgi:hypothetical protein
MLARSRDVHAGRRSGMFDDPRRSLGADFRYRKVTTDLSRETVGNFLMAGY